MKMKRNSSVNAYKMKQNNHKSNHENRNTNDSLFGIKTFKTSKIFKLKDSQTTKIIKRPTSSLDSSQLLRFTNSTKHFLGETFPVKPNDMNLKLKNTPQNLEKVNISQKLQSIRNSSPANKKNELIRDKSSIIIVPQISQFFRVQNKANFDIIHNKQVLTSREIIELFIQKCKDLNVPVKPELMNRFMNFIKEKCVNRIIDLTDCCLGINSMIVLSQILGKKNDFCSRVILAKNNFGDFGIELLMENLRGNNYIVELNLCSNNLGVKGGKIIFNFLLNQKSIISLDLSSKEGVYRNRICSEGVRLIENVLQKNFYLEKIDLSSNSIKNEGMKYIVNGLTSNISLQTLILSNNEINEKGIAYMDSKLNDCKLRYLDLSNNPISNPGLINLGNCIADKLKEIYYLNIANCSFTFEAFKPFIRKVCKSHKLQTMILNNNNLLSHKWDTLQTAISGMAIKRFSLGNCGIGPVMKNVAYIFMRNVTIKYLDFSHNYIGDKDFAHFQEYPINNLSLEELDFSSNYITDKSATLFFKYLLLNNSIQRLNFYDNQLQNESAMALLEAVKENHNLLRVNIKCNRIGLKMLNEIHLHIKINKKIEKGKFIPKLKDELKVLEFNPQEMTFLKDKILYSNRE